MMVIAMHDIYELLCPLALCHHMEGPAVHQVFKKGPEEHSSQKSQRHSRQGILQRVPAVIKEIADDRNIHTPDHQRMCLGKHFQVLIPEQLRLSLIMYFFEFHGISFFCCSNISDPQKYESPGKPASFPQKWQKGD